MRENEGMEENPYQSPKVERKPSKRRRRAYVSVALLVFYVLGFGPFMGLATRWHMSGRPQSSQWAIEVGEFFYAPLWQLRLHGPEPISDLLRWYSRMWCHILIDEPPFDD